MKDVSLIDSNFRVESRLNESDIRFYDVNRAPFKLHGVFYDSGKFRRLPETVAESVNQGVHQLHAHTAGGRVRFKTDSEYVAVYVKMPSVGKMPHFALTGSAGFDLYVGDAAAEYVATFVPPFDIEDGFEGVIHFGSSQMREITVNFPLFSEISQLFIGLSDKAEVCSPEPYRIEKPIVYYGSSITHGGCASRPGCSYQSIVSRRIGADYINLGFSGSAKGEEQIAQYIKGLDMSAFVYDYDHNAPTAEHLKNTHERMFSLIRSAHPVLPIILMSRPKCKLDEDDKLRLEIIRSTFNNAKQNNDSNVYLIEGVKLMELAGNEGTVDGVHPNDLGFASMARAVGDVLESVF